METKPKKKRNRKTLYHILLNFRATEADRLKVKAHAKSKGRGQAAFLRDLVRSLPDLPSNDKPDMEKAA